MSAHMVTWFALLSFIPLLQVCSSLSITWDILIFPFVFYIPCFGFHGLLLCNHLLFLDGSCLLQVSSLFFSLFSNEFQQFLYLQWGPTYMLQLPIVMCLPPSPNMECCLSCYVGLGWLLLYPCSGSHLKVWQFGREEKEKKTPLIVQGRLLSLYYSHHIWYILNLVVLYFSPPITTITYHNHYSTLLFQVFHIELISLSLLSK